MDLPIGSYTVSAEHPGFATEATPAQQLDINQSLRVDLHMQVGSVSETVITDATASQVETVNPTIGGTVTGAPIQNLPLNGRNTLDLALTFPAWFRSQTILGTYGTSNGGSNGLGGISIAGGRGDAVTYLLDGGINNRVTSNQVVFNPNPEAVEEFRLLENNYTVEYGRNGGGTISEVIKSGTNTLHGSLYDYFRNDALNASDYFDNQQGNPRPVLKRNQFGGTIGGPIIIPGLVHGKDRFFFFFGYQGQRQKQTVNEGLVTTYTPAELNGDFSQFNNSGPDPSVVSFLQTNPYYQPDRSQSRAGNHRSDDDRSRGAGYIKAGLIPTAPTGQVFPLGGAVDNSDQYLGKFDFYATQSDRISLTVGDQQRAYPQSVLRSECRRIHCQPNHLG